MASSSSSSSSQSWNHDVFLSFRGEDTRKNFVDHLYTALQQQGIHVYKDDETLARGESIGPALLKAIRESRIAVIVFSKNYADSSWCLDELEYIIECNEKNEQIVMPVFYDIEPSDVRKLKRKHEEAFSKHEIENNNKVESWRKALIKASKLSGWVTKDFANGHEAKCVKDIVGTIFGRLSQLYTSYNKDFIGMETRLQDLKSKLEIGSGGVRMVGIWGLGGGGKTTLASVACMEISHQFEAHCFLENIRDESSKHGLKRLQEKLMSLILKKENVVVESEIEGKNMIKKRLSHKSVLIVLDDVDDHKQLEALAGSHDWFGEGSRIIITTRDQNLLSRRAETYEVSLLSPSEAMKLFTRHAYRKDKPVEDYDLLSKEVVSYANGLPLALEILGSFLYDKDKDEWKAALARLKCSPDAKVIEKLRISYDGLKHDEKELFLDIACFMRRWEIDKALMVLDACSFHPRIGIKVLEQKSLIKISDGKIDMHDLIEEMAHYIVRGEHPDNPEKHSRIWKEEDIVDFCDDEAAGPLMETEVLRLQTLGSCHLRVVNVLANMKKLRWIDWYGYPASSFPSNFQSTKLGYIKMVHGQQKQLWEGCKRLPYLKILILSYSRSLITTPNFEGLPCLERLTANECEKLEEIHPSIGYHKRLVSVNMARCSKLKTFPPIVSMKRLEILDLSWCRRLQEFPDIQTSMDSLVTLHLNDNNIEIIPSSAGRFCTNLVSFDLSYCKKLKRIEGNFDLLKSLTDFNLFNCELLGHQDNSVSLRKFPQFAHFLRNLNLSGCNLGDGNIPSDICDLLNLQVLDLSKNCFSQIHISLAQITSLKFLNLSRCKNLVELPDLPSSIAILNAEFCYSLESVGDLSNYKWLWKLTLWRRNKLIGSERVLHSMLQVKATEDRLMSIILPSEEKHRLYTDKIPSITLQLPHNWYSDKMPSITLQLPHNWYGDFSGFMLSTHVYKKIPFYAERIWYSIFIKQEMSIDSKPDCDNDYWEEFDKNQESYKYACVGYVPFASFKHISWFNSAYPKRITFEMRGCDDFKVGLVPRKAGDSRERAEGISADYSECWEELPKHSKTFNMKYDSNSSNIQIEWRH